MATGTARGTAVDAGWGRLLFGQTFDDEQRILEVLEEEAAGRRDIAMYVRFPQVLVGLAPDALFIDPSLTMRLQLPPEAPEGELPRQGVRVRPLRDSDDATAQNRIYAQNGMVVADVDTVLGNAAGDVFTYLVAVDADDAVVGTVTGVDHVAAFGDADRGSSLWCLAVDPQASVPGVGRLLVRALARHFADRDRAWMDLSVLHDNRPAVGLYAQLGFSAVPVLAVKRKHNPYNEPLYSSGVAREGLNPYAKIIADEAARRGITVTVLDAAWGELELVYAGQRIATRESLSELTSGLAVARCDDKRASRRVFAAAGLHVARGQDAAGDQADRAFLAEVGELVVKPARGEQGNGITVGVTDPGHLREAVDVARAYCPDVLLEEFVTGEDVRVLVIDERVVAAAVRRPAEVLGTGRHTVGDLIEKQSRRRAAATDGESAIPVDDHTRDTIARAGYQLSDVLEEGRRLRVRRTANLHTGGTIHDVTDRLHAHLAEVAVTAAGALRIPVVGLDLLVDDVEGDRYVVVEANERPGLANHEPQPTAERFVDLLFPRTSRRAGGAAGTDTRASA